MTDHKALSEERNQLFKDVIDGKIPKRVPIRGLFSNEFAAQYAGMDLREAQWNTLCYEQAFDKVCRDFYSDGYPIFALRFLSVYQLLGAQNWKMGSNGFLQHPEIEGMTVEDYEDFIAAPYNTLVEKIMPRLYTEMNAEPGKRAMTLAKAFKAWFDERENLTGIAELLTSKYGYSTIPLMGGFNGAPMDFVADQLRGFKGISADIRRVPDKVAAAAEAVLPLMVKMGMPKFPSKYAPTLMPLHMPPFMREKDFAKLYWPTFKKLIETLDEAGQACLIFAEQDWTRYADYLDDLPETTQILVESGDPKVFKEKVGQKHVLMGFYPTVLIKTGSREQCIDKAKELLDILAPGGKYIFSFDRMILTVDSINVENMQAVLEYVAFNANY